MKLNDEKKFFVNKNLFENSLTQQFKPKEQILIIKKRNSQGEEESKVSDVKK